MTSAGKKFDRLMLLDRFRVVSIVLLLLAAFVIAVLAYTETKSTEASNTVTGVVTGLRGIEGDGVKLFLEVQLAGGKEVLVKVPYTGYYLSLIHI